MSESALWPITDDSHSSPSADTEVDMAAASSRPFWPAAVAMHADAALDILADLNIPDEGLAHDAAQAINRIRTNADAACADDLRNTQQHVHHAYAHAEHSPELAVRVATLDAAAAWRLAQYTYETQISSAAALADLEQRLSGVQQNAHEHEIVVAEAQRQTDDRILSVQSILNENMQYAIDARVAHASIALLNLTKKHAQQIQDLQLALTDLQEKHEALSQEFAAMQAKAKPAARKWSLFSSTDANAFASIVPQ